MIRTTCMARMYRQVALLAAAVLVVGVGAGCGDAFAQAATTTTTTTSPILDVGAIFSGASWREMVNGAVSALLVAGATWAIALFQKKTNITIQQRHADALLTAARNGAGLIVNAMGNQVQGKVIDVKNPLVAQALDYVLRAVPDAVKYFGLDARMDELAQKIIAQVPQVANTSATVVAQPVVLDPKKL